MQGTANSNREHLTETIALVLRAAEGRAEDIKGLLENAGIEILFVRVGDASTFFRVTGFRKEERPGSQREARP